MNRNVFVPLETSLESDAPGYSTGKIKTQTDGPLCWKCGGKGFLLKGTCKICDGTKRLRIKRKVSLASDRPGKITNLKVGCPSIIGNAP